MNFSAWIGVSTREETKRNALSNDFTAIAFKVVSAMQKISTYKISMMWGKDLNLFVEGHAKHGEDNVKFSFLKTWSKVFFRLFALIFDLGSNVWLLRVFFWLWFCFWFDVRKEEQKVNNLSFSSFCIFACFSLLLLLHLVHLHRHHHRLLLPKIRLGLKITPAHIDRRLAVWRREKTNFVRKGLHLQWEKTNRTFTLKK